MVVPRGSRSWSAGFARTCTGISPAGGAASIARRYRPVPARRGGDAAQRGAPGQGGTENENVAPGPSLGTAQRRPPWLSTMDRLTDRPMIIPFGLLVSTAANSRLGLARVEPHPRIPHAQADPAALVERGADDDLARAVLDAAHGLEGVADQVADDLLELDAVSRPGGRSPASSRRVTRRPAAARPTTAPPPRASRRSGPPAPPPTASRRGARARRDHLGRAMGVADPDPHV